jgi:hypothetical protein
VLKEPVPSGVLGALRILAFIAVTAGAILLASPDHQAPDQAKTHVEDSSPLPHAAPGPRAPAEK